MNRPGQQDVLELAAFAGEPCLSLYMPIHPFGRRALENLPRLRHLLKNAAKLLAEEGAEPSAVEAMLEPVYKWLGKNEGWHAGDVGLALFVAPRFWRVFRLDFATPEDVCVARRFVLRPLLTALAEDERFYVLALSANQVRVLEAIRNGGRLTVRRLAPSHLPANMADALGPMVFYSDIQTHSASTPALGNRRGQVHGQGDRDQEHYKSDLLAYFRAVAKSLHAGLADPEAPLVLAAVAEYLPLYRAASHDARLAEALVAGNPELESDEMLAARAEPIAAAHAVGDRRSDLSRLKHLDGTPRVARLLPDITRAADEGRIQALFLTSEAEHWGSVDPVTGTARLHVRKRRGDEEMVERAALAAVKCGAAIHVLRRAELPGPADVVAVLRY